MISELLTTDRQAPTSLLERRSPALQVGPHHVEEMVLHVVVGKKVIVLIPDSLVLVALVFGLKLGVQNYQLLAEFILSRHPRAGEEGVIGAVGCCQRVTMSKRLFMVKF